MTHQDGKTEFARLREQAGLTLEEAARVTRASIRSAYRHENGECSPSPLALDMLRQMAESHRLPEKPVRFRFIDLFAGIGGLRVGFESIGGKCVFTSEWDKYAAETYRKNFPEDEEHVFAGDIREYTKDDEALARISSSRSIRPICCASAITTIAIASGSALSATSRALADTLMLD